jgi:alpha-amylase
MNVLDRRNWNEAAQLSRYRYMVGEVFNFGVAGFQRAVHGTRVYDFGDRSVDFFRYGFDALINMGFASHARLWPMELFQLYSDELNGPFRGVGVLNYISSHDDQNPLDPSRDDPYLDATKLLLAPGGVQIYYGDELSRDLKIEGAMGDATLRSFMNWEALDTSEGQRTLSHWRRLAQFRRAHPAVGAGVHEEIGRAPFTFSRTLEEAGVTDVVLVAMDERPFSAIQIGDVFAGGARLRDAYAGDEVTVANGRIAFSSPRSLALIEPVRP